MPHRYSGERAAVERNYSHGAGGSISSGHREEEPTMWVPIEIKRENMGDARKKKADYYKHPASSGYSTGAGGSIPVGGTVTQTASRPRVVPIEVNRSRAQQQIQEDQMWPRKKRSDLKPVF